ncbi:MAG: glycoside-pentoside-hexuronide (GPH):cation symporter [Treponema sp.]|jgi:GPH family glycoside/pentoside/hexuronide:cation symporter|nr:glycoside-pentoside-hexuronide (GPH):cation symporter [Treponema sp.]
MNGEIKENAPLLGTCSSSAFAKTPVPVKIWYGCGMFGGNVMNTLLATFLLSYYTDTALMGVAAVGTMFFLTRILDGVTDIIMGGIVDRTNTRFGKCRPWLFAAAPLMAVGIIAILHVPMGASDTWKLAYAYITYIFLNCIVFTMFGISNSALLARLTLNVNDRTTIVTIQGLFNNLSAIVFGSITVFIVQTVGWTGTSIIMGLIAGIFILIEALGTKEVVGIDAETGRLNVKEASMKKAVPIVLKNKYFYILVLIGVFTLLMNANAIGSSIFYVNNVIKDPAFMGVLMSIGGLPGLVMLIILPLVAPKIGKRYFMMIGCALLLVGFFICGIANGNKALVLIGTIIRSLGTGPLFACQNAFIADITDYGEWKYGIRTEGLISSSQSIGSKIGIGLGSGATGWALAVGGYIGGAAVQPASAMGAINFAFGWLGLIFSVCLLVFVLLMNVEKYLPEIKTALQTKYAAEGK